MPLVTIAADKGSPGVTTVAMGLAMVWPRRVLLADCDPSGGDIALRMQFEDGRPLTTERGMLTLASPSRHGQGERSVLNHVQLARGGQEVLAGLDNAEQVNAVGDLWTRLAEEMSVLPEADVIADIGRVSGLSPAVPMLRAAAMAVFVTRPTVDGVAHLRERLKIFSPALRSNQPGGVPVGVVVVTGAKDSRSIKDIQQVLDRSQAAGIVLGQVAHDPKAVDQLWPGRGSAAALLAAAFAACAGRRHQWPDRDAGGGRPWLSWTRVWYAGCGRRSPTGCPSSGGPTHSAACCR